MLRFGFASSSGLVKEGGMWQMPSTLTSAWLQRFVLLSCSSGVSIQPSVGLNGGLGNC